MRCPALNSKFRVRFYPEFAAISLLSLHYFADFSASWLQARSMAMLCGGNLATGWSSTDLELHVIFRPKHSVPFLLFWTVHKGTS